MNGSPSKIHPRYGVSDEELERIRSIAISRGIKIPVVPYATAGPWAQKRSSTVSGPHSTPRCPDDDDFGSDLHGSQRTVIPTADDTSVPGDLVSNDGTEKSCSAITKEDRATSDNEEDDLTGFDMLTPRISPPAPPPEKHLETLSVRSDTALVSEKRRSVTFITETPDDADDNASFAQSWKPAGLWPAGHVVPDRVDYRIWKCHLRSGVGGLPAIFRFASHQTPGRLARNRGHFYGAAAMFVNSEFLTCLARNVFILSRSLELKLRLLRVKTRCFRVCRQSVPATPTWFGRGIRYGFRCAARSIPNTQSLRRIVGNYPVITLLK